MILPYALRLLCLCLASFFLVHLALGMAVSALTPAILRRAARMPSKRAARFLLTFRLLPWMGAWIAVAGLCTPSYLALEPDAATEEVGVACLLAAACALMSAAWSALRCLRAWRRSREYVRECEALGQAERIAGERVWVVDGPAPMVVLAGMLRPKVMVSRTVVEALAPRELAAALRHERAHRRSRDNFKRLLLTVAPDLFPGWRGFGALESAWRKAAEWAADDASTAGNPRRAVALAGALVTVARLGAAPDAAPLMTSLLGDRDLRARVERLLDAAPAHERGSRPLRLAGLAVTALALVYMMQPATQASVHRLLEHLTH